MPQNFPAERPATGIPRVSQAGPNLPALGANPNGVSDVRFPGFYGGNYVVKSDVIVGAQPVTMTFLDTAGSESATGVPLPANTMYTNIRTTGCQGLRFRAASAAATVVVVNTVFVFDSPAIETPDSLTDMQALQTIAP